VPVAGEPFAVATTAGRVFVAASEPTYDGLTAVDTRAKSFLASLPLDLQVVDIAASHDGKRLFVSGSGPKAADLAIVDVESGRVRTVALADPDSIVGAVRVAANGRFVYVATSDLQRGKVSVVDAANARVVDVIPAVSPIQDFVLSGDGSVLYVLGRDPQYGGVIDSIDTGRKRVLATAWIGGHPTQFALGVDETRMYIVDVDRVAVLCMITNEVIDGIGVGAAPSCVAVGPAGSRLYVADYSGAVSAFEVPSPSLLCDAIADEPLARRATMTTQTEVLRELEPA